MRARVADVEGSVACDGVDIHYAVYGTGPLTVLLMPTWTIVHAEFWKFQIPYLSRRHRVVVYDGPGNGRSGRPLTAAAYDHDAQVGYAVAVLDATRTTEALVVALSKASTWALDLAAHHPGRVVGTVLIGSSNAVDDVGSSRATHENPAADVVLEPSGVPIGRPDPPEHWAKYDDAYWLEHYEDFLWFFFGQCFPEQYSTKAIEDCVGWGRGTDGAVLVADGGAHEPDASTLRAWCAAVTTPVLVLHGDDDRISPLRRSEVIADLVGAELVVIRGGGHLPLARDPVAVNLEIARFADRISPREPPAQPSRTTFTRWNTRRSRVLYLSSPIGLGHARRDLAIAGELRTTHPDIEIEWLSQDPVTRVLGAAGERVHPASRYLANESAHIESEAGEHDLHCFEALRRMDEVLLNNFMVFHDVVRDGDYDLVVGDESWEVDHFLHENPALKRCTYAWMTDFVGYLPMPDANERETLVVADYNAEMIDHVERYPHLRDRAIFIGDPDDIVDERFGAGLPVIRDWTEQHYEFAGYVTGRTEHDDTDRQTLRAELGYRPDQQVCIVTVGGSGVGGHLISRVVAAYDEAARRVNGLRMIVVTGPRIDASSLPAVSGLEVRDFVPDLDRHLAACDLAVVQGGLTTCMELTASRRPFIYVPLRHHFEQNLHVTHRLDRYRAGTRLDYDTLTPDTLAAAIADKIGTTTNYRDVETGGAARAAGMLAQLL